MNIFFLDYDPETCARWHLDKHVIKMPLEHAQMMSCVLREFNGKDKICVLSDANGHTVEGTLRLLPGETTQVSYRLNRKKELVAYVDYDNLQAYRPTHSNHPCTLWIKESLGNWRWLKQMTYFLNKEYQRRTNRFDRDHASWTLIKSLPEPNIPDIGFTEPAQALPPEYRIVGDSRSAYWNYYNMSKTGFAVWNKGADPKPFWFTPLVLAKKPCWYKEPETINKAIEFIRNRHDELNELLKTLDPGINYIENPSIFEDVPMDNKKKLAEFYQAQERKEAVSGEARHLQVILDVFGARPS